MEIQTIQSAVAGIRRMDEFFALEEREEPHACVGRGAVGGDIPFVEFRDVTFGYDEHMVLRHLSFKVMDGEQVTLAGRTGVGKSTIFKLLLGLYQPQSGEVLIHGVPAGGNQTGRSKKAVWLCRAVVSQGDGNSERADYAV